MVKQLKGGPFPKPNIIHFCEGEKGESLGQFVGKSKGVSVLVVRVNSNLIFCNTGGWCDMAVANGGPNPWGVAEETCFIELRVDVVAVIKHCNRRLSVLLGQPT